MFSLFQKTSNRILFFASFLLLSCGGGKSLSGEIVYDKDAPQPQSPSRLQGIKGKSISGEIVYDKDAPQTYQGEFKLTSESHAVVSLIRMEGEDSEQRVITSQKIGDIDSFPIPFRLQWVEDLDFSNRYTYSLAARVFKHRGEEMQKGDLMTETVEEWEPDQGFVTLRATAVELCSAKDSGGFCLGE